MLRRFGAGVLGVGAGAAGIEAARFTCFDKSEQHTLSTALTQFCLFDALRIGSWFARRRHDADCANFPEVQAELLRSRLAANRDTVYGREHNFQTIMGSNDVVDAYRSSHPLTRPDHYQSYVAQILAGDEAVLNAEAETMLAATSGTSGQRNILPYTPTMGRTFFSKV